MNDAQKAEARQALTGALLTEAVSMGAILLLWGVIRYRTEIGQLVWRARSWQARREQSRSAAIREVWRDISKMEHGQWEPGDTAAPAA